MHYKAITNVLYNKIQHISTNHYCQNGGFYLNIEIVYILHSSFLQLIKVNSHVYVAAMFILHKYKIPNYNNILVLYLL